MSTPENISDSPSDARSAFRLSVFHVHVQCCVVAVLFCACGLCSISFHSRFSRPLSGFVELLPIFLWTETARCGSLQPCCLRLGSFAPYAAMVAFAAAAAAISSVGPPLLLCNELETGMVNAQPRHESSATPPLEPYVLVHSKEQEHGEAAQKNWRDHLPASLQF